LPFGYPTLGAAEGLPARATAEILHQKRLALRDSDNRWIINIASFEFEQSNIQNQIENHDHNSNASKPAARDSDWEPPRAWFPAR